MDIAGERQEVEVAAHVRSAELSDAERLAQLCSQLGYEVTRDELETRLSELLSDPRSDVFVAETNDVAGMATLHYTPTIHEAGLWARVTAVVVDDNDRGSGVGSALIEAAEMAARKHGCSRIEATSALNRSDAHRFYESHGYEQTSAHFLKRLD